MTYGAIKIIVLGVLIKTGRETKFLPLASCFLPLVAVLALLLLLSV